jgi:hypothetical protein
MKTVLRAGAALALLLGACAPSSPFLPSPGPSRAVLDDGTVLNRTVPLETEHNRVVHVSGKAGRRTYRYDVLFGPYPPGQGAKGRGAFVTSEPTWQTWQGYTYAVGWWPIVKTNRVKAVTKGTTIVVQVGTTFDRVFLLKPARGSKVDVEAMLTVIQPSAPSPVTMTLEGYVQATDATGGISLSTYQPLPPRPPPGTPDEIWGFLNYVMANVDASGVASP